MSRPQVLPAPGLLGICGGSRPIPALILLLPQMPGFQGPVLSSRAQGWVGGPALAAHRCFCRAVLCSGEDVRVGVPGTDHRTPQEGNSLSTRRLFICLKTAASVLLRHASESHPTDTLPSPASGMTCVAQCLLYLARCTQVTLKTTKHKLYIYITYMWVGVYVSMYACMCVYSYVVLHTHTIYVYMYF